MEKRKVPVCGVCPYMRMTGRGDCNKNNDGKPRGNCWCEHPDALEMFRRLCPRSPRAPGFIGFTPMGGNKPKIKTSPRWCPLRLHWFPAEQTEKEG